MGTGSGGDAAIGGGGVTTTALRGGNRLDDNIADLVSKFPATPKGYFGRPGQGRKHTRNIESDNPARTAAEFASIASRSHVSAIPIEGKGMMYRMRDGSIVSHRYVSSSKDGSPVVELKVKNASGIKSQKIHFVKKGK